MSGKSSPAVVPFGALVGFNLGAEIRLVAAHYGVRADVLRKGTGARSVGEMLALARAALFWRLTKVHSMSPQRVAALLKVDRSRVFEGAKRHAERIEEFRTTHNIKLREPIT